MSTRTSTKSFIKNPELIHLDKIQQRGIDWLWPGLIPLDMLTVLAGDPGVGKSYLTHYMASIVSTGRPWPNTEFITSGNIVAEKENYKLNSAVSAVSAVNSSPPGSVLILNNEDIPPSVICPRLIAMNADLSKIKVMPFIWLTDANGNNYPARFDIANDIIAIEKALKKLSNPKLLIIDPMMSFFGNSDTYRDANVRSALLPLSIIARNFNIAVVCVMHLNKGSSSKIIYRTMGSQAFSAFARSVWFVNPLPNPENKKRCLLLPAKNNIVENPQPLAFEIKDNRVVFDTHPFNESAQDVLPTANGDAISPRANIESPELNRAVDWLKNLFLDSNPIPSKKIFSLAEEHGFSNWTMQRARKELGIYCFFKKDPNGKKYWSWKLPSSNTPV
jgi:putative DNA primase/helicase